ncbi:replicative DNA helicase [Streptomyces californicus]|uniref:replicative DNA helicase n=1 Tax=Streptomyces californicus TaxID=67351 RepID=UPI00380D5A72
MTVVPAQNNGPAGFDTETFERVPPHSREAEMSVLGSMMLSKEAAIECQDILQEQDYYFPHHATIHRLIVDLHARGVPCDPIQLGAELHRGNDLTRIGGAPYLHTLVQSVDTPANATYHADIVRERGVLRRLIEAGIAITQAGFAGHGSIEENVAEAAARIAAVVEGTGKEDDFVLPEDTLEHTLDQVENNKNNDGVTGAPTGFIDLDSLTNGFQPGQMVVVAARPGMGKSTFAMDIARACAVKHQIPAAFISLEMDIDELNMRLLSAESKVALHHLRLGTTTDEDWTSLARHLPRISQAPLYINDSATTLATIQAKLRRLKSRRPDLGLVVIDYLQLVTTSGRRPESRQQEVSDISRSLKLLAKELQVPIIALSQLNRGPELRTDKKPMVSDLRESGSIEQDADIVVLLHREDAYDKESARSGEVDLIIAKHRGGPTATITVGNQLHYSRFVDMVAT